MITDLPHVFFRSNSFIQIPRILFIEKALVRNSKEKMEVHKTKYAYFTESNALTFKILTKILQIHKHN